MKISRMYISGLLSIEPEVREDGRGSSYETFNLRELEDTVGHPIKFVQDYHSRSKKGVLRGLHYQHPRAQGKLVRVVRGEIYDVVVDMRKGSPTFGWWEGEWLSEKNRSMLWVPPGFAHGFLTTSDEADVIYRMTNYRFVDDEKIVRWDDPDINVKWPLSSIGNQRPVLSERDAGASGFAIAPVFSVEDM